MIFDGFRLIAAPPPPSSGQVPALRAVVESLAAALLPVLSAFSILLLLISIGAPTRSTAAHSPWHRASIDGEALDLCC